MLPKKISKSIESLKKLPGVGDKIALKYIFHMIKNPSLVSELNEAILSIKNIKSCCNCFGYTDKDGDEPMCDICSDIKRDSSVICVVPETKDIIAIDSSREYRGSFHVLQGLISPMEGIGPAEVRIKELLVRIKDNDIKEVIFAFGGSIEAEATTLYITKILKPIGIKLSQLAFGIAVGCELENSDPLTLGKAILNRREL